MWPATFEKLEFEVGDEQGDRPDFPGGIVNRQGLGDGRLQTGWLRPGAALIGHNGVTRFIGAGTGLVAGLAAGSVLASAFGGPVEGSEGLVSKGARGHPVQPLRRSRGIALRPLRDDACKSGETAILCGRDDQKPGRELNAPAVGDGLMVPLVEVL